MPLVHQIDGGHMNHGGALRFFDDQDCQHCFTGSCRERHNAVRSLIQPGLHGCLLIGAWLNRFLQGKDLGLELTGVVLVDRILIHQNLHDITVAIGRRAVASSPFVPFDSWKQGEESLGQIGEQEGPLVKEKLYGAHVFHCRKSLRDGTCRPFR